jgi:transcription initiation factor TFIIIB Brf1 subunit/transcription initiation factor TFIIB
MAGDGPSEYICPYCKSNNIYFDEKYFQLICRECLKIVDMIEIIEKGLQS